MEFSVERCKKSLDFALADNDARSGESNNSDRGSSSSSHCSQKLGDDDHVVRFDVKEILRRKLQGKTKSMLAEDDLLKKWQTELCVAGFSCEILNLTTKHSPLEETEPPAHFPECVLVLYPSNVYTYAPQTGPFQPVRLWKLQCPIYEHMIVKLGALETLESSHLAEVAKEMLCGDQTLCPGIMKDISGFGYDPKGGDTDTLESGDEETEVPEHNIDNISNEASKLFLLVAFNANSFDYLSVNGNLAPVAKHLKVKTQGLGKYQMACRIAKELLRQPFIVPRDPAQKLNYNHIKRSEIESRRDLSFLFRKSSSNGSSKSAPSLRHQ